MTKWRISAAARNHRGQLRPTNEDNFYLNGRWLSREAMLHGGRLLAESGAVSQLYAVCDGLGGAALGAQASLQVTEALRDVQAANPNGIPEEALLQALHHLTDQVCRLRSSGAGYIGATLAACLWRGGRIRVLSIGDCRLYRLRGGVLHQLTTDHTEVQQLIEEGMISPEQARLSPRRHLINQYIGLPSWDDAFRPYLSPPIPARAGDGYLLCSDGLTDMVEDAAIRHALLIGRTPGHVVDLLVQKALDNGGQDNITALCMFVQGPGGISLRGRLARYASRMRGYRL